MHLLRLIAGKKKIKIEFEDTEGSKYNLSLDGEISKGKILKVYEIIESLNLPRATYEEDNVKEGRRLRTGDGLTSVGSKVWYIIESKFPNSTFTSTDIQDMYEEEYKEPMRLDAIATYLSRFVHKGKLERNKKGGKEWVYKVLTTEKTIREIRNSGGDYNPDFGRKESANSTVSSFPQRDNTFSSLREVN